MRETLAHTMQTVICRITFGEIVICRLLFYGVQFCEDQNGIFEIV